MPFPVDTQDDSDFGAMEDIYGDDGGSASEEDTDWDESGPSTTGSLLKAEATGRVFLVTRVERASGGYRPNFLFNGELVEVLPGTHKGGHRLERVLNTNELQLSLRYEPPSPKFTRTVHGQAMVSYRLKLIDGQQFIYLQRGLPKVLILDERIRAVGWGQLQLVFNTEQQLESFLKVLKHVEVVHDKLWPRSVAALWGIPHFKISMDLPRPAHQDPGSHNVAHEGLSVEDLPQADAGSSSSLFWSTSWLRRHRTAVLATAATGTLLLTAAACFSYHMGRRSQGISRK